MTEELEDGQDEHVREENAPGVTEPLSEISEVSEELDSKLWIGRISMAWDAIRSAATATQDASQWLAAWVPAMLALQKIGSKMVEIGTAIRQNVVEGEEFDLDEDILLDFRDDFASLAEVFPDAGHILGGVEVVDDAVDRIIESELAREQAMNLLRGLERLMTDLVGTMIDIWMHPETFEITPEQATLYLNRVETLLQRVIDRILEQTPLHSDR